LSFVFCLLHDLKLLWQLKLTEIVSSPLGHLLVLEFLLGFTSWFGARFQLKFRAKSMSISLNLAHNHASLYS